MLLDGRLGIDCAQILDVGRNDDWLDLNQLETVIIAPGKEINQCPIVSVSGILVPDVCGKELKEPLYGSFAAAGDDRGCS